MFFINEFDLLFNVIGDFRLVVDRFAVLESCLKSLHQVQSVVFDQVLVRLPGRLLQWIAVPFHQVLQLLTLLPFVDDLLDLELVFLFFSYLLDLFFGALFFAFTRVYLSQHYFEDMFAGAMIGFLCMKYIQIFLQSKWTKIPDQVETLSL